jgi:hypothetical protein
MFFIVWGFRARFKRGEPVVFFCPKEGGDRQGHHGVARRWFTLFWIPLIPLKVLNEYVECETCHTRYDESVLQRPTTANLSEVLSNAVRVLTAMIVRVGDQSSDAMRAAAVTDIAVVTPGYTDDTLASDVAVVDPSRAEEYVHPLADGLETAGKERFLADLCRVALAADTITDDQRRLIESTGRAIGLTPAHVSGIVSTVVSASSPAAPPSLGAPPALDAPPAAEPPTPPQA